MSDEPAEFVIVNTEYGDRLFRPNKDPFDDEEPKMSKLGPFDDYVRGKAQSSPMALAPKPTLAELRAKVTEAEAAYGRAHLDLDGGAAGPSEFVTSVQLARKAAYAAREALRKAEEAERKPRLASVAELQSRVSAGRHRDDDLVRHTRGDMLAAIRKIARPVRLETAECKSLKEIYFSDIEALVREAGE